MGRCFGFFDHTGCSGGDWRPACWRRRQIDPVCRLPLILRSDLEPTAGRGVEAANVESVKSWRPGQIYVDADRPGSAASYAGLICRFLGVNSGFGFADGPGFGRGSQNAGVFLEIGSDEYFDHMGWVEHWAQVVLIF